LAVGFLMWLFVLGSGIHSTIAGVLLALTIPSNTRSNALEFSQRARRLLDDFDGAETGDLLVITSRGQQDALHALDREASAVNAPLLRLEHDLHAVVAFGIMPLFALSNAGVSLGNIGDALGDNVVWGIVAGLLAGKFVGITFFSWLAVRFRLASLPAGVSWHHLCGAALLAGIGFTMSLFIAGLAFPDGEALEHAKIGVLLASTAAGLAGFAFLRRAIRGAPAGPGRDSAVPEA
jgi:NhaA family Na+:H+ antiporter